MRARRNAAASLSAATLERITRRVVEPAIAAALTTSAFRNLHAGHMPDPIQSLSRTGWISRLDPQHLLTPLLDRATSQQQKQHPGDSNHQQLPGRQAAKRARGGGYPNRGGRRKPMPLPICRMVKDHASANKPDARDDPRPAELR